MDIFVQCNNDPVVYSSNCAFFVFQINLKMTDFENSLATIVTVFIKYARKEGDKHKLKKSELKDLINNELSNFLEVRPYIFCTSKKKIHETSKICISVCLCYFIFFSKSRTRPPWTI